MNPQDNHLLETIKSMFVPIHRLGWPFIAAFAVGSFILGALWEPLGWIGMVLTLWCVYFFRDPIRVVPQDTNLLLSPGDGLIQMIREVVPPAELEMGDAPLKRISIFLNVFDVHVNRSPVEGIVSKLHYMPGKFFNASLDKASEENERQMIRLTLADGRDVGVIQIAGLVARRIVCEAKESQTLRAGERFGLIRFGSRVDVFLPPKAVPLVIEGQRAIGGETVLADLSGAAPGRTGVSI